MKLPLRYYGDPILRKKCEPIAEITDEIRQLAADMIETMDEGGRGIGLSAPQVGHSIRLFVLRRYIHLPDGKWALSEPHVYVNPKILGYSQETWVTDEGCLSIPKLNLPVERPFKVKVESTKLDGTVLTEEFEWHNGRVIMHENDHLNGVLYIDRVPKKFLHKAQPELREIKKKYAH